MYQTFYRYVKRPGAEIEIGYLVERVVQGEKGQDPTITFQGRLWPWDYDKDQRASYRELDEIKGDYMPSLGEAEVFVVQQDFLRRIAHHYNRVFYVCQGFQQYVEKLPAYGPNLVVINEANTLRQLLNETGRSIVNIGRLNN
jgi:hypothetical protein